MTETNFLPIFSSSYISLPKGIHQNHKLMICVLYGYIYQVLLAEYGLAFSFFPKKLKIKTQMFNKRSMINVLLMPR